MGIFDKIFKKNSKPEESTLKHVADIGGKDKAYNISDNHEFNRHQRENIEINKDINKKKQELDNALGGVLSERTYDDTYMADLYKHGISLQNEQQNSVKGRMARVVRQRFILTKMIDKFFKTWPSDEPKVIDMMIDSEKEIVQSGEAGKNWEIISNGIDGSDKDFRHRMFDLGSDNEKTREKVYKFFDEPVLKEISSKRNLPKH